MPMCLRHAPICIEKVLHKECIICKGPKRHTLVVYRHTFMYVEQNEEKRKGIRLITYRLSRVIV